MACHRLTHIYFQIAQTALISRNKTPISCSGITAVFQIKRNHTFNKSDYILNKVCIINIKSIKLLSEQLLKFEKHMQTKSIDN
jgi:aspartyl/asparaginyl beta-hydroxylase (cupin superfamily)